MLRLSSGVAYKHQPFLSSRAGFGRCRAMPRLQRELIRKPTPVHAFFGLFSKSSSEKQSAADLIQSLEGEKLVLTVGVENAKKPDMLTAIKKLEEFSKDSQDGKLNVTNGTWKMVFTTKQVFARTVDVLGNLLIAQLKCTQ